MEELYRQVIRSNKICLLKNYSNINDRHINKYRLNHSLLLLKKKYKHRGYFYDDKIEDTYINLQSSSYITVNSDKVKKHFNNPFAEIFCEYTLITLVKKGDELTLRRFYNLNIRKFNARYVKNTQITYGVKFNLKTGNFTVFKPFKNLLKFRKNNFNELFDIFSIFDFRKNDQLYDKLINELNIFRVDKTKENKDFKFLKSLIINNFMTLKKIKVPNEYDHLLINHYPTEKFLKKNDRKLCDSILENYGIKSKFINKKLHKNQFLNFYPILFLKSLFGDDYLKYISNLNDSVLNMGSNFTGVTKTWIICKIKELEKYKGLIKTKKEKENIIKIINDYIISGHSKYNDFLIIFSDLVDHFNIILSLKKLNIEVEPINSTTFQNFLKEHNEINTLIQKIKRDYSIKIIYDDETIKNVEEPINIENETYFPIILKNSEQYDEESKRMHHCVAGYIYKTSSIIISLRKKNNDIRVNELFMKN